MKKYKFTILFLSAITGANAQVAIGKASITKVSGVDAAVSLEFYDGTASNPPANERGLILPWASVNAGPIIDIAADTSYKGVTNPVDGTLLFDPNDFKVKYRKAGAWFDLSVIGKADMTPNPKVKSDLVAISTTLEDKAGAKATIGTTADSADGVLVLTDNNKAMILPKVASPQTSIQQPSAGMIVYDTDKGLLCVYNGTVWTFWKP